MLIVTKSNFKKSMSLPLRHPHDVIKIMSQNFFILASPPLLTTPIKISGYTCITYESIFLAFYLLKLQLEFFRAEFKPPKLAAQILVFETSLSDEIAW